MITSSKVVAETTGVDIEALRSKRYDLFVLHGECYCCCPRKPRIPGEWVLAPDQSAAERGKTKLWVMKAMET